MLERYAICLKLSAEKKQCQLIYIDDPLALECRPIPKAVEQNINIGCWLKVQFNPEGNRKTWELTEDGPFLTSISAQGNILITIPIFFPPCLSSLAPYLNIPDYKIGTWYFHALLAGDDQIQGEWKPNIGDVKINHIYKGKFEIELQDHEGTPKWTLLEVQDQWDSLNGRISPNSALFVNGTCQQGPILKINGHLAIILGEDEKLVYAELEEPNECAVGDFIEYKTMNITFNGASVPIGIKCNGQHCPQIDSSQKNMLRKISSLKDYFRIRLDAANWGQLFEPVSNRIKGIGPLTCLPQHSAQLSSPKTLPIFIKVQALFYYEFHSVLWTVLEITDNERSIYEKLKKANTVKKCAEKVPEDICRGLLVKDSTISLSTSTLASSYGTLEGDHWEMGKYAVYLCKKGDEAILMEFSQEKRILSIMQMKLARMPRHVDIGQCMEMDYKIMNRKYVRKLIHAVRNVKKMDAQFIRTRILLKDSVEFLVDFYECIDAKRNQYRTSLGHLMLPNGVCTALNGNSYWCQLNDLQLGKVDHCEKIVPPVALAHPNAFTKNEMRILYEKASNHFSYKMIEIEVLYRCKFVEYFHKTIFNNMLMAGYTKNGSGHQGCPINKLLDGLFFSTFQPEPGKLPQISPFGNIRLRLAIGHLLAQPDVVNLYFADFYCNKLVGTQKHNIVLVLCRKGTEEDEFCANHLILLQIWANQFLMAFRRENDGIVRFKVASNGADKINIYLAGSLKLPNYYSMTCCYIEAITPSGDGTSSICGLQHNDECAICNIDKKNNSNMLLSGSTLSIENKFRQKYVWKLQCAEL